MNKLDNAAQGLEGKQYKEANEFMKQIQYKEVLNKEIADARDYTNIDKYGSINVHQLMKTDKQHIIEVLIHAMGTIRYLKENNGKK
tara:strand:- start:7336 stop:7593 length:258 start_codon:yes stop_codon:yes gene_type:complete